MELMNVKDAARLLGVVDLGEQIALPSGEMHLSKSYYLPSEASRQTILARTIARLLLSCGPCWLQITYWNNDADSNQDLFHVYRKGMGDERTLAEASIYRFHADDESCLASVLCMVLYFAWDARIFDSKLSYEVRVNNDGFLDLEATSDCGVALEHALSVFGLLELA